MTRHLRILLLLALALPALVVAACGGVPGNAVATVDGDSIDKTAFDHWTSVIVRSSGQAGAQVPKPPDYAACLAQLRKTQPKPAKGVPKVSDAQLKRQCKQQYDSVRDQAVQLLASFKWIEGEAKDMGIKVGDAEVNKEIANIKKQEYPKKGDFEKLLKQTGFTQDDIVVQTRNKLLTTKITDKVSKGKNTVSDAEIKAYYDKNRQRFAQPERRDLRVVLTKTEGKARQAKKALDGGSSFASVAKRLSIDQASKAQGGKLPGVAKGQQEKALDTAVFAASKRKLEGPVKTQFGYYVFEVTKVVPASQQSLQQAQASIKQLLTTQKQQKAVQDFAKSFQKKWKAKTECRDGFVTSVCKGAPAPKATATPAQQQAPPPTATP